jgi:UDPglucose--hexose-1-phosphate uridylyltransferase
MRQDILTGDWISVAAARQNRASRPPNSIRSRRRLPTNPSEIPSAYDVAVFENRSPSFGPALLDDAADPRAGSTTSPTSASVAPARASGAAKSCASPRAHRLVRHPVGHARPHRDRGVGRPHRGAVAAPGIQQVFPFENRGEAIGVTLHHPHGQIYAYPYVTPRTLRLLDAIDRTAPDLFDRILAFEQNGPRVVLRGEHFTAFVPFAARWPIELHVLPHRHVPDFAGLTDAERDELAPFYLRLLRGIDALYDTPTPYIAAWHQAPVHVGRDTVRLNLQLTSPRRAADKLKYLAGSEAAMGAWIGDVPPRPPLRGFAKPSKE